MALSPVSEESPDDEGLHRSDPLSGASSYSGDSFESSTDESDGRYKSDAFDSITNEHTEKYHSESFESCAGESGPLQSSDSFTNDSGRNYESESFESLSSDIDVHQTYSSENSYIESAAVEDDHKEKDQVAYKESSDNENKALQSYCSVKIEHLRQPPKSHRQRKGQPLARSTKTKCTHQSCPVPPALMNRLELQRTKETVNQVMKTEIHDPGACPDCCNKQAELAQYQFIRMKKTKLEADLLHKKLEERMYSKDLVTCIGEIHQSLPKPSEEQTVIWQRLYTSSMKA